MSSQKNHFLFELYQVKAGLYIFIFKKSKYTLMTPKHYTMPNKNSNRISPREVQVLMLLREGNSRKMIAAQLALQNETINSYLKTIYRKLNVNNSIGAIRAAERESIV
jgi:DNA-binding NarL/FixJ family response regulator